MTPDQRADLLVCCADGLNQTDRAAAHQLLRDELRAELDGSGRDYSLDSRNRAFDPDDALRGGADAAQWFFSHWTSPGSYIAAPVSDAQQLIDYALVLSEQDAVAALITHVQSDIGVDRFAASRRRLRARPAASGAEFLLDLLLSMPDAVTITLDPGDWQIEFQGTGWTLDTAVGASVDVDVQIDGVTQDTWTHARAAAPVRPGESSAPTSRERDQSANFNESSTITLASAGVLTIVNSGAFEERLKGIFRYFPVGS